VSILLTAIFHKFAKTKQDLQYLFQKIDRAVAVLEVMEECVVTRNATLIIKRTLTRAKKVPQMVRFEPYSTTSDQNTTTATTDPSQLHHNSSTWINLPQNDSTIGFFLENDGSAGSIEDVPADVGEIDWLNAPFTFDDGQQALFWVEWAHHLDGLGQ
jgi:hypothetical protein